MSKRVYGSRLIKRPRSYDEMEDLLIAVQEIVPAPEETPITIRHLFYRLVSAGVIPKTELAYKSLVQHLSKWRREGWVRWDAFADSTRWHIRARTFDSAQDALQRTVETYRRHLWSTQA